MAAYFRRFAGRWPEPPAVRFVGAGFGRAIGVAMPDFAEPTARRGAFATSARICFSVLRA